MDWQLVYLGQFYLKVRIAPRYRKTFKPMIWRLKSATDLWHLHDKKNPMGKLSYRNICLVHHYCLLWSATVSIIPGSGVFELLMYLDTPRPIDHIPAWACIVSDDAYNFWKIPTNRVTWWESSWFFVANPYAVHQWLLLVLPLKVIWICLLLFSLAATFWFRNHHLLLRQLPPFFKSFFHRGNSDHPKI